VTHYKELIETEFLGQWDLPPGRDVIVTIAKVERYTPRQRKKKKRDDGGFEDERFTRIAISFEKARKRWLSGPATQAVIAKMYGNNVEGWVGKKVALYVDHDVKMGRAVVGGIRVRPTPPKGKVTEEALDNTPPPEKVQELEQARDDAGYVREPGSDDV